MIFGLKVKLPIECHNCGFEVATITRPAGKYYADFKCAACGGPRGSLTERTGWLIQSIANSFGAPTTPIVLRRPPVPCTRTENPPALPAQRKD